MLDFIGNEIKIGSFVAYPGAGNVQAEYGLLLMRVLGFNAKSITVERLDPKYTNLPDGSHKTEIIRKKSYIKNRNKLVVVKVDDYLKHLFENPEINIDGVASWIHGNENFDSNGLFV